MTDLVCDECGASVPADAAFCSECGAGLQPESSDNPDSDEEVDQANVLEKYDDKWYEHDGSKTNYAVILEDGSKKYYKELTWVEKRLKDEYEDSGGETDGSGSTSSPSENDVAADSSQYDWDHIQSEIADDSDRDSSQRSALPGFRAGATGRNTVLTVVYLIVYPIGILLWAPAAVRYFRSNDNRFWGTGERVLSVIFAFILVMMVIGIATIALVGVPTTAEIHEASLSNDQIVTGEEVEVSAIVANPDNETHTFDIELTANGEVIDETDVRLEPHAQTDVQFLAQFEEGGEYEIEINDQTAGTLTVAVPFTEWQQTHSEDIRNAESEWERGEDLMVEAEQMEPSLVESPVDKLEEAMEHYDEAYEAFGELKEDAREMADMHPEGSAEHERFTLAAEYYRGMEGAALYMRGAVRLIVDNAGEEMTDAEQSTVFARLEQVDESYLEAQQAKTELNDLMGTDDPGNVDTSGSTDADLDASETVLEWMDTQENLERNAVGELSDGNDAFDEEEWGQAMDHYEQAQAAYAELEERAIDEQSRYAEESETYRLFGMVVEYYGLMEETAELRYQAAYEIAVNDDEQAHEEYIDQSVETFNQAQTVAEEFEEEVET